MMLLKYLIAIIGILHQVEAKAFQASNVKGTFDHMYENVYLKKIVEKSNKNGGQSYEMRYVPHVDGKPIFIPFDEFETLSPPDVIKTRPNQLRYKPDTSRVEPTKKYQNFVPQKAPSLNIPKNDYYEAEVKQPLIKDKEKEYVKTPIAEFPKVKKENLKMKEDHPVVIDVVTQAVMNSNYDLGDEKYVHLKKQPEVKKAVSEQGMKHLNKNPVKQEKYEMGPIRDVTKKDKSEVNSSLKVDYSKVSKPELKEKDPNYPDVDSHEKSLKEISLQPFNHEDSPVVVESITKDIEDYDYPIVIRPLTEKHKESIVGKTEAIKINEKPTSQDYNLKTSKVKPALNKNTKITEKVTESDYKLATIKQKQSSNHEDYDSPVIVENFREEATEDYDYPLVIRPFSEKHSGVTNDKTKVVKMNKPVVKDNLKYNKMKPALNEDSKIPDNKATKTDYKLAITKKPINFLSDVSMDQDEDNPEEFTKIKLHKDATETKLKDSSVENLQKEVDYPSISEVNHSIDSLSHSSDDYDEEYDIDGEYEDYDKPEIVEALVQKTGLKIQDDHDTSVNIKKTTVIDDYDSPVVVEALVKKTNEKDNGYDTPIISEVLIEKNPVKNTVEQTSHLNKNYPIKNEDSNNYDYEAPVVVEALVKKNNKKRVKYSTKMKPPKSSTHSYYEDSSTSKNKISSKYVDMLQSVDKSTVASNIKTSEEVITTDPFSLEQSKVENFSNEDPFDAERLGDVNDQFDAGSGIIKESTLADSRSFFSKSNVWPLLTSFHSQERNKFKKCTTPSDEPGNCMPIQMCPTPNLQLTLDDLLKKICAIDEVFIGICCPEFPAETLKVDWENVKNASSDDKEALETKPEGCGKIQEFGKDPQSWPWMAPLISVSTRRIFCGGVLIKEQYVLTAAHCTRKIPRNQIVVVLGPSEKDATPQEFEVIEIKRHAQYNPKTMQNDLALLKLSRKVRRPFICLPDEEIFVGVEALMLGWQGSFAASKTEEKLLVISPQECRKGAVKIIVGDNIMCTEPRTEDVMCNVDSGAPLVIKRNDIYQVIGLLTWNRNDCDSSVPAIFTRVSHFKRWIENHAI